MNHHDYPLGSDTKDAPWQANDPEMKECPCCEGTKKQDCLDCHEGEDDDGSKCLVCSGTGLINCEECNGTGKVEKTDEDLQADEDYYEDLKFESRRDDR